MEALLKFAVLDKTARYNDNRKRGINPSLFSIMKYGEITLMHIMLIRLTVMI